MILMFIVTAILTMLMLVAVADRIVRCLFSEKKEIKTHLENHHLKIQEIWSLKRGHVYKNIKTNECATFIGLINISAQKHIPTDPNVELNAVFISLTTNQIIRDNFNHIDDSGWEMLCKSIL